MKDAIRPNLMQTLEVMCFNGSCSVLAVLGALLDVLGALLDVQSESQLSS